MFQTNQIKGNRLTWLAVFQSLPFTDHEHSSLTIWLIPVSVLYKIFLPLSIFVIFKGSYGVVKLAYNEDEDKYYVSTFKKTYKKQLVDFLCPFCIFLTVQNSIVIITAELLKLFVDRKD